MTVHGSTAGPQTHAAPTLTLSFDGGCPTCVWIAAVIAEEADGRVGLADLNNGAVRAVLDEIVGPQRQRAPYLIRSRPGSQRAFTGWRAVLELVVVIGVRRALRIHRRAKGRGIPVLPPRGRARRRRAVSDPRSPGGSEHRGADDS